MQKKNFPTCKCSDHKAPIRLQGVFPMLIDGKKKRDEKLNFICETHTYLMDLIGYTERDRITQNVAIW